MKYRSLLRKINRNVAKSGAAWGFQVPESYSKALKHDSGDTLADFVTIEIYEGAVDGEVLDEGQAYHVIERARDDLNAVLAAM